MKRLTFLFAAAMMMCAAVAQTNNMELAEQALENEDAQSLIQYTTEHIKTHPKDARALALRSTGHFLNSDMGNAFADINAAIKCWNKKIKEPTLSALYIIRSYWYQEIEEYEAALSDLNMAVKKGKKDAINYASRAEFYYDQENYALAESDYRTAFKLEPTDVDFQIGIGKCLLAQKKYDEAEKFLQKLTKMYSKNQEVLQLYTVALLAQEKYKDLVDSYIIYLNMTESSDWTPLLLAAQKEFAYTIAAVTDQITAESSNYRWLRVRAMLYRQNRQYTEALADWRKVESILGDSISDPFGTYEAAQCYDALDDYSQSVKQYNKLIDMLEQHGEEDAFYYLKRGIAYRELGEYDKTIADCNKSLSLSMDYAAFAYYLRGWAHEASLNNEAAFDDYSKSILFDSTYAPSYLMRGEQYLFVKHDTTAAMQDFERILKIDTTFTDGSCRQYALMFLGKTAEAKIWMNQIITNAPSAGNYYDAACLYARIGEADEAMQYLRQAFEYGFRRIQHLEVDKDMDTLRDRQDFKELIAKYKKEQLNALFRRL